MTPTIRIRTTFEIWTPEDVDAGDTDDKGWEDEEGTDYTFQEAFELVRWCEPSSSEFHDGVWYTHHKYHENFRTGSEEHRSYHFDRGAKLGFQRRLFAAVRASQQQMFG